MKYRIPKDTLLADPCVPKELKDSITKMKEEYIEVEVGEDGAISLVEENDTGYDDEIVNAYLPHWGIVET